MGSVISNVINLRNVGGARDELDREELKLIADYLEIVRHSTERSSAISGETAAELDEYLGLAEAALRRARAEIGFEE